MNGRIVWPVRRITDCQHTGPHAWCTRPCAFHCGNITRLDQDGNVRMYGCAVHQHCACGAIRCHGPWWRHKTPLVEIFPIDRPPPKG